MGLDIITIGHQKLHIAHGFNHGYTMAENEGNRFNGLNFATYFFKTSWYNSKIHRFMLKTKHHEPRT
jgi:hypothetical protein